jgi:hypothetical protein
MQGTFVFEMRDATIINRDELKEPRFITIREGQFIDDERMLKERGYILKSIRCTKRTGRILQLPYQCYKIMMQHAEKLSKFTLHTSVLNLCPPMIQQTQKSINNFLNLFELKVFHAGTVLSTEISSQSKAAIVLHGDVLSYKRVVQLTS